MDDRRCLWASADEQANLRSAAANPRCGGSSGAASLRHCQRDPFPRMIVAAVERRVALTFKSSYEIIEQLKRVLARASLPQKDSYRGSRGNVENSASHRRPRLRCFAFDGRRGAGKADRAQLATFGPPQSYFYVEVLIPWLE